MNLHNIWFRHRLATRAWGKSRARDKVWLNRALALGFDLIPLIEKGRLDGFPLGLLLSGEFIDRHGCLSVIAQRMGSATNPVFARADDVHPVYHFLEKSIRTGDASSFETGLLYMRWFWMNELEKSAFWRLMVSTICNTHPPENLVPWLECLDRDIGVRQHAMIPTWIQVSLLTSMFDSVRLMPPESALADVVRWREKMMRWVGSQVKDEARVADVWRAGVRFEFESLGELDEKALFWAEGVVRVHHEKTIRSPFVELMAWSDVDPLAQWTPREQDNGAVPVSTWMDHHPVYHLQNREEMDAMVLGSLLEESPVPAKPRPRL
jgi:hypothetical protein